MLVAGALPRRFACRVVSAAWLASSLLDSSDVLSLPTSASHAVMPYAREAVGLQTPQRRTLEVTLRLQLHSTSVGCRQLRCSCTEATA